MTADDTLKQAAKRAREVLPDPVAEWVENLLLLVVQGFADDANTVRASVATGLAPAVLALPVPAPAVDREGLIRLIADASNHNPFPEAEDIADTLIEAGAVRGPEAAAVVTEHAIGMTDGSMQVRPQDPEIERIYPLAEWIPARQRFGGKVYRRRIRVVVDWVEVD